MTWSLLADTWPLIPFVALVTWAFANRDRWLPKRWHDYSNERTEEGREP